VFRFALEKPEQALGLVRWIAGKRAR
jgi:hypothetical protein